MSKRLEFGLLAAVVALGLALRLWQIGAVAPTNPDEAMYLRQARFMSTLALKVAGRPVPVADEAASGIWRFVRKTDWYEKPCWAHSGMMAIAMLAVGQNDLAGALESLVFSLAAVILVFLIGRRLGNLGPPPGPDATPLARWLAANRGAIVGLLSALLLAIGGYWLVYSRGMWAEADSVCFALIAVWLVLVDSDRERPSLWLHGGAGLAAALAVLCHYRLLYVVAPLGLAVMLLRWRRGWLKAGIAMAVGFFGLLIGVDVGLKVAVKALAPGFPFSGLFGAVIERFTMNTGGTEQTGMQPMNLVAYLFYVIRFQGMIAGLLLAAGAGAVVGLCVRRLLAARRGDLPLAEALPLPLRRHLALLLFIAVPLAMLVMQVWVVPRAATLIVPFTCLLAAVGLVTLLQLNAGDGNGKLATIAAAVLLALAVAESLSFARRLAANRMGHREVAAFLAEQPPGTVYADPASLAIYQWYQPDLTGEKLWRFYPDAAEPLDPQAPELAGSFAVFDGQKYHMYPASRERLSDLEAQLGERAELVATAYTWTTIWQEMLLDGTGAHTLGDMLETIETVDLEDLATIRVYRLR